MRKPKLWVMLAVTVCAVAFTACNKELDQNSSSTTSPLSLPQKVSTDLATAKSNWNNNVGSLVTLKSFNVVGSIKSAAAKDAIISQIMADDAMAAYGNILDDGTMHLSSIGELQTQNPDTKTTMRMYLDEQLNVGDLVVDIAWQSPAKSFVSKCIVHNDEIVWDNLLTSSISINPTAVETSKISTDASTNNATSKNTTNAKVYAAWYSVTYSWQGDWIWGSKRGDMGCTITIYCQTNGHVYSTDHSDYANMVLGSAKSESKVLVNTGTYGKIQYALGIATPFASVSFSNANFKVSVSGLGSSMIENGSKTLSPW